MSRKGCLFELKDGGPHKQQHVKNLGINIDVGTNFSVRNASGDTSSVHENNQNIQDGGEIANKMVSDNLQFLSISEMDELDSYDREVVENNAEWLKTRCRNLENDDFDILTSSQDDSGVVDLFGADSIINGSLSDFSRHISSTEDQVRPEVQDAANMGTIQGNAQKHDFCGLDNAGLELHQASKNIQDFNIKIDSDKANALMTPHEIACLPEKGLEFEESVAKDCPSNVDTCISVHGDNSIAIAALQSSTNSATETVKLVSNGNNALDLSSLLRVEKPVVQTLPLTNTILSPPLSGNQGDQSKLATISISTDKTANSTRILVNTNQGQQLYQINTSDLTQASQALGALPKESLSQPVVLTEEKKEDPSLQTGYLILQYSQLDQLHLNLPNGVVATAANLDDPQEVSLGPSLTLSHPAQVDVQQLEDGQVIYQSVPYFMCTKSGCNRLFKKKSKLRVHEMKHDSSRPFQCPHEDCEWAFKNLYKLRRHVESHEGRRDYICDIPDCGRRFTTIYNLNCHRRLHERPCAEECTVDGCHEKFATKRQLDLHMKSHPGNEKNYKCPVPGCGKMFFSKHCMGSHPRVHSLELDLTCKYEGCGKVFDKVCRLKQHMRKHSGEKPYKCRFEGCGWAFLTASKLKRHQAKHTGLRKFKCDQCGKAFMRSEHLKGHLLTHTGEKPFACPVEGCPVRVTAKSSLYFHMKRHERESGSGERLVYHCPMEGCQKHYSTKVTLRKHMVKQHVMANNVLSNFDFSKVQTSTKPFKYDFNSDDPLDNSSDISKSSESQNTIYVDPSEFITAGSLPVTDDGEVEEISSDILSQILSSDDSSQLLTSSKEFKAFTNPVSLLSSDTVSGAIVGSSEVKLGSARTDFMSNHLLSDRAKKRRQLLKDKVSADGHGSDQDDIGPSSSTLPYGFASSTSRGITFRDPETGVMYVQTQLLQDDPPSSELYCDDVALPGEPGPDSSGKVDSSLDCENITGTIINLHDIQ